MRSWFSMRRHNKHLEFKREPDFNEYIIILPPSAFRGNGCYGKCRKCLTEDYINTLKDNIIGKLHIITKFNESIYPKCDCCQKEHNISDFVKPYSLLIKLHKENLFVNQEKWELLYLKSQITELQDILMYLGAYEIEYNVVNTNYEANLQGASADISIYGINVGGDIEIEQSEEKSDSMKGKIIFKKPSLNINILLDNERFHYLPSNHDWQHMVHQRLQSCIGSYEITTTVTNNTHINRIAKVYLDKLGIKLQNSQARGQELIINMSAQFCEMTPFQKESCNLFPALSPRFSKTARNSNSEGTIHEKDEKEEIKVNTTFAHPISPLSSDDLRNSN